MIKNPTALRHQQTHKRLSVWIANEEYEVLKIMVSESGLTISDFVRSKCLNKKIKSNIEAQLINALAKLGGLQIKLNTELRQAIEKKQDTRITELIMSHNNLYREIQLALKEVRGE